MLWLVLGLVIFLGAHSVRILAPGVARRSASPPGGEGAFKGASIQLISALGLVLIVWGYGKAWEDAGDPLRSAGLDAPSRRAADAVLLHRAGGLRCCPRGRLKPILKHPMLLAVKIWALAHLIANGDLASVVLFGAFLLWAAADRVSRPRGAVPQCPGRGRRRWTSPRSPSASSSTCSSSGGCMSG
jgi:uncharacterized membrane protein